MSASVDQHSAAVEQAAKLKERNRGSMNEWLYTGYDDQQYESPRPRSRTNTDEAKKNSERDRGVMTEVMAMKSPQRSGSPTRHVPKSTGTPANRCSSEAARTNQGRHAGDGARAAMGGSQEHPAAENGDATDAVDSPAKNRTRPEGAANAAKNKGCMDLTFASLDLNESPKHAGGRGIKAEGQDNFNKNQGSLTGIMSSYASNERSPPPNRRVKQEGNNNAARAHGTGAKDCLSFAP